MKEQMTYVAIDTDNVGESIGNAVLQDDEVSLSSLSEKINLGTQIFTQWAENHGGEIISSGSDEAMYRVPVSCLGELEQLKQEYTDKTGFTVSIGIGSKLSEAAKSLIYAKMNGKDQIIDFSPEIETTMKQNISGELNEEIPESEGEEEEKEEIEVPKDEVDGDYGTEEMAEGQPEHEEGMDEEEEFIHDAQENREDEADEDIVEADEESIMEDGLAESGSIEDPDGKISEDEALDEMADSDIASDEDIDLDGRPDQDEEHGEIEPEDDLDNDGDVEHEEAMTAEAEQGDEYTDEGDFDDEYTEEEDGVLAESIEGEMSEETPEEAAEEDRAITEEDLLPSDMLEQEQEIDQEELQDTDHEAIKDVIYESLQNFKQNREHLEQIKQQNPELYMSLINTLQAMIEMARDLGYGNMDEMEDVEEADDMIGEEESMMMGEEEVAEEIPEEMEEEPTEDEMVQKAEFIISKLKDIQSMMKSDDEEKKSISPEEIKEKIKKKIEAKKKGSKKKGGKRKPSTKKPKGLGDKDKKKKKEESNDGSFCAKSHKKMRASGKDCRANEDKDSPLCSARRKMNCRGKNEEKGQVIEKSEKLKEFLSKKRKK